MPSVFLLFRGSYEVIYLFFWSSEDSEGSRNYPSSVIRSSPFNSHHAASVSKTHNLADQRFGLLVVNDYIAIFICEEPNGRNKSYLGTSSCSTGIPSLSIVRVV